MSFKSRQRSAVQRGEGFEAEIWAVAEKSPDFTSRMIMKLTKQPYSHVLFYFNDRDGKNKIVHAVAPAVRKETAEFTAEFLKTHTIVVKNKVQFTCTKEYFCGYINCSEGTDYGQLSYFFIKWGWKLFKGGKQHPVCSTFIARILHYESNCTLPVEIGRCQPSHVVQASS